MVESLDKIYLQGDIHTKQQLLGSIFSEKLYFENNEYRTLPFNKAISLICNTDGDLQAQKKDKSSIFDDLSCEVGRTGLSSNYSLQINQEFIEDLDAAIQTMKTILL